MGTMFTKFSKEAEPRPWEHCPAGVEDQSRWSKKCKEWCKELKSDKKWSDYSIRTHLKCPKCGFTFIYRTTNWSMSSSADVINYGVCANVDCKHEWDELS